MQSTVLIKKYNNGQFLNVSVDLIRGMTAL